MRVPTKTGLDWNVPKTERWGGCRLERCRGHRQQGCGRLQEGDERKKRGRNEEVGGDVSSRSADGEDNSGGDEASGDEGAIDEGASPWR